MYSVNPIKLISSYWHNRTLIKQLVKKEIYGKFQETHLGFFWVVFEPLLMLAVYTFVFRVIFNRQWLSETETTLEFSAILFSGLLLFNFFRETVNSAPRLIIKNTNYVKKVVFPLEILPLVSVLTSLYHLFISMLILIVIYIIAYGQPNLAVLYTPLILLPYILIVFGVSLFLSSTGVYIRDVAQIVAMIVMGSLFLSAIFYPIESVPEKYQIWFYFNPIAFTVDQFRSAFMWGESPELKWFAVYYPVSIVISWLGFFWFQKTRKGFSDVL